MLNERRSIIRSSSGKPHWLPSYILEAGFLLCFNYCF